MMTIPERMAAIRACLEDSILPAVARDSQSELRAIIKLIDDMTEEVDHGSLALLGELDELLDLCERVSGALQETFANLGWGAQFDRLKADFAGPVGSLTRLAQLHHQACMMIGSLAVALADKVRQSDPTTVASDQLLLRQCYETLRRHAATRATWQSIFSENGLFSGNSLAAAAAGEPT